MKGTFRIASFFGIPIQVHWSFALILVWVVFSGYSNGMDYSGTLWLGLLMIFMFISVVLHEYGHALTARRFGVETRDIILLPIGGVARLEKIPERPIHEFWVAIAGPLVNIALAILLSFYFLFEPLSSILQTFNYEGGAIVKETFIFYLIIMNVGLALFNLIPAFPMDGGRILRALLSMKMDKAKATNIASIIGQVLAAVFIVLSVITKNPMSVLLGAFIFFVARQENKGLKKEQKLNNTLVSDLYKTDFTRLERHDTIQTAQTVSEIKKERDFVIVDEQDKVIGVLHELFLKEAVQQNQLQSPVMLFMSQRYTNILSTTPLLEVIKQFQKGGYSIVPVLEDGKLVGVIDQQIIKSFLKNF